MFFKYILYIYILFGDAAFSEYFFSFSLYGEYVVRSFLPDGVFSTLSPRAGFLASAYVRVQSNQSINHGDKPLLRPTGIQISTKRFATLQAMAPTNVKTIHQTSFLHIESNLNRLGLLSSTHNKRSQQQSEQITLQSILINKSKFLKATHRTEIRKNEIPRSMVVEALSW